MFPLRQCDKKGHHLKCFQVTFHVFIQEKESAKIKEENEKLTTEV